MFLSRKKPILLLAVVMMVSMLLLSACGSASNMDFATYMKEQPAARASIDAQLAILSADAKGSVQYVDNKAAMEVTIYGSDAGEKI